MVDTGLTTQVPFERRYEIRGQLWFDGPHGGWLAFDSVLHRDVVLNIPYRSEDNTGFIERARLRAKLRHANIIPLLECGMTHEDKPFFTEPYIQTFDLSEYPFDEKNKNSHGVLLRQIEILLQVCKAVAFLHANELVHWRLIPSDILINRPLEEVFLVRGHPSLPAAKLHSDDPTGEAEIDLPAYLAPEQAYPAHFGRPTPLTDVYRLGGILYYILYGQPPNQGAERVEILQSLIGRKNPPVPGNSKFRDSESIDLVRKLESVYLRALENDQGKRQKNVMSFSNEIRDILMRMPA